MLYLIHLIHMAYWREEEKKYLFQILLVEVNEYTWTLFSTKCGCVLIFSQQLSKRSLCNYSLSTYNTFPNFKWLQILSMCQFHWPKTADGVHKASDCIAAVEYFQLHPKVASCAQLKREIGFMAASKHAAMEFDISSIVPLCHPDRSFCRDSWWSLRIYSSKCSF